MRAIALTGAALHVLLCTVAGYAMWFFATFPFENQSSEQAEADDWLLAAAGLASRVERLSPASLAAWMSG